MILIIPLTSCTSTRTKKINVPDSIVNGESVVKIDVLTNTVSMPYWYWKDIVEYIIVTEENK